MKRFNSMSLAVAITIAGCAVHAQSPPNTGNGSAGASTDGPFPISTGSNGELHEFNLLILQWKQALKNGETDKAVKLLETAADMAIIGEPNVILSDIYMKANRWDDVIRILRPLVYPPPNVGSSVAHMPTTRMRFVLALLEKGNWSEAVTVYKGSFTGDSVKVFGQPTLSSLNWQIPGYQGPEHTLPQKHFSVNDGDYTGLQAQAHLILGAREPEFIASEDMPKYMLDQLKQSLKYNPDSLDAHFLSGILMDMLGKFADARAEFAKTARMAPESAQDEIKAAVKDLDAHEKRAKEFAAWNAAHPPAKPEGSTPQP